MIPANVMKRNARCPCGSGKKTKNCCINKIQTFADAIEAGRSPQELAVERILGPKTEAVA